MLLHVNAMLLISEGFGLFWIHEPMKEIEEHSDKESKMGEEESDKQLFWDSNEIVHGAFLKI